MKRLLGLIVLSACMIPSMAQQTLSLDSCRAMALRNNKQLGVSELKKEVAHQNKLALRTKYFPRVDALGTYQYFSKEISLLTNDQKDALNNFGTNIANGISGRMGEVLTGLVQQGFIDAQTAQIIGQKAGQSLQPLAAEGDAVGGHITEALRTDTRHLWGGTVMLRQPVFLGGALIAANKMAGIAEEMASDMHEGDVQSTLYKVDETYWLVVSLKQKHQLTLSLCSLLQKLNEDVEKLIEQGLTTRATGLKVAVKLNEAEMARTKVENGLTLSKMLLCQMIGLPLDSDISLLEEKGDGISIIDGTQTLDEVSPDGNRSELKMLAGMEKLAKQSTNVARALSLPQVMLTGGYFVSNPNVFNGFNTNYSGVWNVGVEVRIPIVNWVEGIHQVKATKTAARMARLQLDDAREKINLQVQQSRFKVKEANKRLAMAMKNAESADENLRCANIGFKEGVMESTDVLQAQTAWESAHSARIDAEIEVRMAQINLRKSLGILE